ncbi:MAG: DUF1549 and DUF1553 domain-containing protein [Verrucomicrobiaceae bacterium]|nr:DUF1549 and DUF1553 domain-containing protein [Verrucomicrobiaceae bacterium]
MKTAPVIASLWLAGLPWCLQARTDGAMDAGTLWSFQPLRRVAPPSDASDWPCNDIDRFILAKLRAGGLRPAPDADAATLRRRMAFDLTGLPPAPSEMAAPPLSRDERAAYIDRLLASPGFGEKWGRHWLDVARYAESSGMNVNFLYAEAWRYRDYVIASFNADKPYDQFVREQIAGDLLPCRDARDQAEKLCATGFLALGPKAHDELDREKFLSDVADDQIDTVTQAMLALTVACARCHDHKHDPVTQRDYYALAGIFLSSEPLYGTCYQLQNWNHSSLVEMPPAAGLPSARAPVPHDVIMALDRRVAETKRAEIAASFSRQTDRFTARFTREEASFARAERSLYDDNGLPRTLLMATLERDMPADARLLVRGDVTQPAGRVPRGFVRALTGARMPVIREGSGRRELAECIASKDNPLTARVMVNRVWAHLFGRGIVATPDDFGRMGARPSHPELLDFLALRFIEHGWSVKQLVREIMLSRAYQMSTCHDAACAAVDPDNELLWRMNRRRLDAESVRDAILAVSGTLIAQPPAGSPVALLRESRSGADDLARVLAGTPHLHRAVYLPVVRGQARHGLGCFDFPDPAVVTGRRTVTNVPAQSLFLMNDDFVQCQADAFAVRMEQHGGTSRQQALRAFAQALSRPPDADERESITEFIAHLTALMPRASSRAVLAAYCEALFACGEFRYLN